MNRPVRLGIAGLGTVGGSLVQLIQGGSFPLQIVAVSARDRHRRRECDLSAYEWIDDPLALANHPGLDVIVELIGGSEGTARLLVEAALAAGKHVVTANKALLATHGAALAARAEQQQVGLLFEAAVAGGVPVLQTVREGLAGNRITALRGILNGTCNHILTAMETSGQSFAAALSEAQALGYAEADPAGDIDGIDTAHKLAVLSALASRTQPNLPAVAATGIRALLPVDLAAATALGCRIKLLATAIFTAAGARQSVRPTLVPALSPLGQTGGVLNAIALEGSAVGSLFLQGRGAGGSPTASAVLADLLALARQERPLPFGAPVAELAPGTILPAAGKGDFYLRFLASTAPTLPNGCEPVLPTQRLEENFAFTYRVHDTEESALAFLPGVLILPILTQ